MPTERQLDNKISRWLEAEAPMQLPDRVLRATFERTRKTRQQATWQALLRRLQVNRMFAALAGVAVVVVVALVAVGLYFNQPGGIGGVPPTPTQAPSPTATPPPTAALTATPEPTSQPTQSPASPPPLTQSFTSTVHGISVSYPEGWIARAATEPWTDCLYCSLALSFPQIDMLHRPPDDDSLFLRIASQPIGDSTPEDWVAAQMASDDRCTTTEPIIVDGATGLSGGDTCLVAVVTTAGRGYHIDLWMSPDDRDLVAQYDRAWFEEVLATVQLHPEDAVDVAPSASPSP